MNTLAILTAAAGFLLTFGSIILYFQTIPKGTVPRKIGGFVFRLALGSAVSATAIYFGMTLGGSFSWIAFLLGGISIAFASTILWLLSQRKTPLGDIKVKVGDRLEHFVARTANNQAFSTDEFSGRRILLKFFRGGWCPYCSAELLAFDNMRPELREFGIDVYALSKDTPEQAKIHETRDNLALTLLSDAKLEVIRQFRVEHHKTLGQTRNPTTKIGELAFGIAPFKFEAMAIPTTLLIDEYGIVRWIDQADDIRIRSNEQRVLAAVRDAFGSTETSADLREAV